MHRFVFHNDQVQRLDEASLSAGQAGLFNGWGLFTTLRIYSGRPFAFPLHWARLSSDADRTRLPLPLGELELRRWVDEVLRANQVQDGCARVYFSYNKVGFWHSDGDFPEVDCVIYTTDLPVRSGAARLTMQEHGRFAAHPLTGTKTTSWLNNTWFLDQAQRSGFDESLLLNERGEVSECTSANVYSVHGDTIYTPPLSSGCLAGITRKYLLEAGSALGAKMEEKVLLPEEVRSADEIFITSSTREIQPVSCIDDQVWDDAPGPVTRRAAEAFKAIVKESIAQEAKV